MYLFRGVGEEPVILTQYRIPNNFNDDGWWYFDIYQLQSHGISEITVIT
jgi:hypothetical protein